MSGRIIKIYFLYFLVLSFTQSALAQVSQGDFQTAHRDFFNLYAPDERELNINYIYEPDQNESSGPGSYTLNNFSVSGEVPSPIDRDTFLIYGGDVGARFYDFKSVDGAKTALSSDTLQKYVGTFGIGKFVTEDLLIQGALDFGLYSDFNNFDFSNSAQVYGRSTLVYRVNPGTQFVTGLYATEDLDNTNVFPILGFRAQSSTGQTHFSLTAPVEFHVIYNNTPDTQVYLRGSVSGEKYNMEAGPDDTNFDVKIQDKQIGTGLLYWFTDNLKVDFEVGLTLDNKFTFETEDPGQFNGDMNTGVYFALGLGIGL